MFNKSAVTEHKNGLFSQSVSKNFSHVLPAWSPGSLNLTCVQPVSTGCF